MAQQRWREAQALARALLAMRRAAEPPDAPGVHGAIAQLALALLPEKRFDEAEQLCRQALAAPRPDHGSGGAATAKLIRALAWSIVGQLRFEEALPFLEEAYQILLATEGEESPDAMQAAEELATIRMDAGRGLEQSAALLERCLAIREQQGEATVPEALFTSLKLGICYARLGRNADAVLRFRPYFEHADVPPTGTNAVVDEARWRLELLEDCERSGRGGRGEAQTTDRGARGGRGSDQPEGARAAVSCGASRRCARGASTTPRRSSWRPSSASGASTTGSTRRTAPPSAPLPVCPRARHASALA